MRITPTPIRAGDAVSITFTGEAGDLFLWQASFHLDPILRLAWEGVLLPAPPTVVSLFLGRLPSSGTVTIPFTANSLPAGFGYMRLFHQTFHRDASTRQIILSSGQVTLQIP